MLTGCAYRRFQQSESKVQCPVFGSDPGRTVAVGLFMVAEPRLEKMLILDPFVAAGCSTQIATTGQETPIELGIVDKGGEPLLRGIAHGTVQGR